MMNNKKIWTSPKVEVTLVRCAQHDATGPVADNATSKHKLAS